MTIDKSVTFEYFVANMQHSPHKGLKKHTKEFCEKKKNQKDAQILRKILSEVGEEKRKECRGNILKRIWKKLLL